MLRNLTMVGESSLKQAFEKANDNYAEEISRAEQNRRALVREALEKSKMFAQGVVESIYGSKNQILIVAFDNVINSLNERMKDQDFLEGSAWPFFEKSKNEAPAGAPCKKRTRPRT